MLTTYGRASGLCVDPIEKKPLNHFYPGSTVLSFGTAGCNLGCKFCQNWTMSRARELDRVQTWAGPDDIVAAAIEHGCQSVAFTYNDPVVFAEYAIDVARACRANGIKTVAVSAGYISEAARADLFSTVDAVNIDLKSFSDTFYRKLCLARLQPVLDTLLWLRANTNVWIEVTTLLVPGANDEADELSRLCQWCATHLGQDTPLHFSAYYPAFRHVASPTPPRTLITARDIATSYGLRFVYTGNILDPRTQSTYCPHCDALLIHRQGYRVERRGADASGRCVRCGYQLVGHFDDHAWAHRQGL